MLLYKTFWLGFIYKVELRYDEAFLVYFPNMICFVFLCYLPLTSAVVPLKREPLFACMVCLLQGYSDNR